MSLNDFREPEIYPRTVILACVLFWTLVAWAVL